MVTIKFFAVLKKLVGQDEFRLSLAEPITLKQLIDRVEVDIPKIRTIMQEGRALVAINQEMANENSLVQDGDEVALLPPFAGGML
jgi:molybdopterin converting factor small subunit